MTNTVKADIKKEFERASEYVKKTGARVLICSGTGCVANGALDIYDKFLQLGADVKLKGEKHVTAIKTGCHGFCEQGVFVAIPDLKLTYVRVKPEDVAEIIEKTLKNAEVIDRLLFVDPKTNKTIQNPQEIDFYKYQTKKALFNCGQINPENIDEYIAARGYEAIDKVIKEFTPEQVCNEVEQSGLRGRGGGGFPTGKKWNFVRMNKADQKYVICNADEGDPGAFMDCGLMEGDPHRLIEGMIIAAYAVESSLGYIYVRAEYPLAVKRLKIAIQQAEERGFLGDNIFGTDFSFRIKIKEGAGAFVCGEETALIASIEGDRGMPMPKPPFPANEGLFGKPTLINNVETYANITMIILNNAEQYKKYGTGGSPGTKTFSITGEINNSGLIEVPLGTTLKEIVYDIGGGIRNNKKFKAVQIGGPSGGCLTEQHLDLALDYESLKSVGAMVGSGGLVVMNEDTCIVEVARFFLEFTQSESCGKCIPCREGTKQMLHILEKIVAGKAELKDLKLLEELAEVVQLGSLCGLGKTAPNPVLSTLKYFKDEYLAHIVDKRCPAGVCEAFKTIKIDPALCKGCTKCSKVCPVSAISGKIKETFVIDQEKCIKCGACLTSCPFDAIKEEN
ncbi:MAG TPA: NADH-quinone oxidoreductase subunit NuoF [Candidatus Gastranaerophilales bacterium]|nr:NADH-quinone oxidoreductase subunit NuoF [Candidatus Gastranaerophilales bacterium]